MPQANGIAPPAKPNAAETKNVITAMVTAIRFISFLLMPYAFIVMWSN